MLVAHRPDPARGAGTARSSAQLAGLCRRPLGLSDQLIDSRIVACAARVVEPEPAELLLDLVHFVVGFDRGDVSVELDDDRPPALPAVHGRALAGGEPRQHWAKDLRVVIAHSVMVLGSSDRFPSSGAALSTVSCRTDLISCAYDTKSVGARAGATERDTGASPGSGATAA